MVIIISLSLNALTLYFFKYNINIQVDVAYLSLGNYFTLHITLYIKYDFNRR